jgi:hypothetical protein
MTVFIGLDPGKATGMAWWGGLEADAVEVTFDDAGAALEAWIEVATESTDGCVVACERFTIGPDTIRKSRGNWSLELIGVARFLCRRHGAEFRLQAPGDAKGLFPDEALRRLGWWHHSGHARDALRHLGLARIATGDRALAEALATR